MKVKFQNKMFIFYSEMKLNMDFAEANKLVTVNLFESKNLLVAYDLTDDVIISFFPDNRKDIESENIRKNYLALNYDPSSVFLLEIEEASETALALLSSFSPSQKRLGLELLSIKSRSKLS